jgi:hypothetical protein
MIRGYNSDIEYLCGTRLNWGGGGNVALLVNMAGSLNGGALNNTIYKIRYQGCLLKEKNLGYWTQFDFTNSCQYGTT